MHLFASYRGARTAVLGGLGATVMVLTPAAYAKGGEPGDEHGGGGGAAVVGDFTVNVTVNGSS